MDGPAGPVTSGSRDEVRAGDRDLLAPPDASSALLPADCVSITLSHHPDGYDAAEVHAPHAKLRVQDCRVCHGYDLAGCEGAPSCDGCHQPGWRGNCLYCHGGELNTSGAPPRELDLARTAGEATFLVHTAHVQGRMHDGFDCVQCHLKPMHALSPGHMFDDTHGRAEVDFSAGLSPSGRYDGDGGCAQLYCHGDGRNAGSRRHDDGAVGCESCHGYGRDAEGLTASHARHLQPVNPTAARVDNCSSCHPEAIDVSSDGPVIASNLQLHVNGIVDVALTPTTSADTIELQLQGSSEQRCVGRCHGVEHGPAAGAAAGTWNP